MDYVPYLLPVVSSLPGFPRKNHVPPTILFIILFYILKYLHPLSLPHILSSSFNYYFLNKSYQSQSHCTGFRALSWRMFLIDIENFDIITRSILPCSFLPWNLVQSGVCWNLSQIPLSVSETIYYFLFEDYCFARKAQVVWLEIFYFMKIILFSYFVFNIFFPFL